jgi:redox-sensitive bicupin YhaK (pirin superfamily)
VLTLRRAGDRGRTDWDWLDSRHTFSFGEYHDSKQMGFRSLRVLNDDRVEPGKGFGEHGHRDMEILSYVLEGALEHRDSLGNGSVIRPGEIQFMRAGTGVRHSEKNHSPVEPVHFLQIWILPAAPGLPPAYDQKPVDAAQARRGLALLASRDGRNGSIALRQDVDLMLARVAAGEERRHPLAAGRHAYVHLAEGEVSVNGVAMAAGDGAALSGETDVVLTGSASAEVLLFDLA